MRRAILAAVCAAACLPDEPPVAEHIDCDSGACTCSAGFGNCDGEPDNGCEADLATDPRHCGECGRDCLGGTCAGSCQPYELVPALALADVATIDGRDAYFGVQGVGTIARAADDGGGASVLAADQLRPPRFPWVIATGGEHAYWDVTEFDGRDALQSIALDGKGPVTTLARAAYIDAAAASDGMVAIAMLVDLDQGSILRVVDGAGVELGSWPSGVAVPIPIVAMGDDGSAYWLDPFGDLLWRMPAGSPAEVLYESPAFITGMTLAGEQLVWTEAETESGDLLRTMPAEGGEPVDLYASAKALSCPRAFAGDLLFAEGVPTEEQTLLHMPLGGGTPSALVALALDFDCPSIGERVVVWVEGGHVYALAR